MSDAEALELARGVVDGKHDGDRSTYFSAMLVLATALLKLHAEHAAAMKVVEVASRLAYWRDMTPTAFDDAMSDLFVTTQTYRAARNEKAHR